MSMVTEIHNYNNLDMCVKISKWKHVLGTLTFRFRPLFKPGLNDRGVDPGGRGGGGAGGSCGGKHIVFDPPPPNNFDNLKNSLKVMQE